MTDKKMFSFKVTPAQHDAINTAVEIAGDTKSELIRQWFKRYCKQHGVEWPDDMPEWGGLREPDTPNN